MSQSPYDGPAAKETNVQSRVKPSFDVEEGDGMALHHDDPPFPRWNVESLRDPNERRHRDYRAANVPMNVCEDFMEGGWHGRAGLSMTREEHAKFLAQCKEFVLGMNRLEQTITKIDARLTQEEQRSAVKEVFE